MNSANLKVIASYSVKVTHVSELNSFEAEFLHVPRLEEIKAAIVKRVVELATASHETATLHEKTIDNLDNLLAVLSLAKGRMKDEPIPAGAYTFEVARILIGSLQVTERKITVMRNDADFIKSLFPAADPEPAENFDEGFGSGLAP